MGGKKSKAQPPGLPPAPPGYEWTQNVGKNDIVLPAQNPYGYDMMNPYMQSSPSMMGMQSQPPLYGSNPMMSPGLPNPGYASPYGGASPYFNPSYSPLGFMPRMAYPNMGAQMQGQSMFPNPFMPGMQPGMQLPGSSLPIFSPLI